MKRETGSVSDMATETPQQATSNNQLAGKVWAKFYVCCDLAREQMDEPLHIDCGLSIQEL